MTATTEAARPGPPVRPRSWPALLAWALLGLALVELGVFVWFDRLLRRAGRPDWPRSSRVVSLARWWRC